jgi:hypothetical protein
MAEYLPPTENLPIFDSESFKDSNNEFLTYDKANKYFLKFPNAQGTENFNTLSANEITAPGDLLLNPVGSVDMNGKVLNMTDGEIHNCPLVHSKNNEDIIIEGKGTGKVILKTNNSDAVRFFSDKSIFYKPLNMNFDTNIISYKIFIQNTGVGAQTTLLQTEDLRFRIENNSNGGVIDLITSASTFPFAKTTVLEVSSGAVIIKRPITLNDASSDNRGINSSVFNFNEVVGGYNPTVLYQIYQTGATANHINYVNSGRFNFSVINAGSTLVTPLQITSTSNNIPSNINLVMAAGTGIINQPYTTDSPSANNFKKTNIIVNSGVAAGSATSGLEIYDDFNSIGKGLFILPNSGSGSLSTLNLANDCAIVSRSPQNNNAISITNWNSDMKNGIRIFTTDVSNCGMTLQCGSGTLFSEFRMAFNRTLNTFTTSYNNPINFNPTTYGAISPARRLLSGLGTLSFTDILGNTTGGTTNSTITMDSLATVPGLNFDCSLNSGNHNFTVNNLSGNKINPFSVGSEIKHNVPTIMSDFTVPLNLSYAGGLITGSVDDTSISSAIGTRELTNYLLVSKGTYIVNANFRFASLLNDAIVDRLICGIGNTTAAFNAGGQFSTGVFRNDSLFTIQNPGTERRISTTVLSISSSNTTIYFNYLLEFTSVSTLMSIGLTYSITRIA